MNAFVKTLIFTLLYNALLLGFLYFSTNPNGEAFRVIGGAIIFMTILASTFLGWLHYKYIFNRQIYIRPEVKKVYVIDVEKVGDGTAEFLDRMVRIGVAKAYDSEWDAFAKTEAEYRINEAIENGEIPQISPKIIAEVIAATHQAMIDASEDIIDSDASEDIAMSSYHDVIQEMKEDKQLENQLTSDGWHNDKGDILRISDVWYKAFMGESRMVDTFVEGFQAVQGTDDEGLDYCYDSVRVIKYFDVKGKEMPHEMEFIPWYDGSEVRNVEISDELKEQILASLPAVPRIRMI